MIMILNSYGEQRYIVPFKIMFVANSISIEELMLCQWPIATILTDLCKMTFHTDLLGVNNWKHDIAQCEAKFSGEDVVPMPFQQSLPYAHPGPEWLSKLGSWIT
jgi:hypothetical protein